MQNFSVHLLYNPDKKSALCRSIITELPEWFGMPESNQKYIAEAAELPAIAVTIGNDEWPALLLYQEKYDEWLKRAVIDIRWMGVLPRWHRHGLGRLMVGRLFDIAGQMGIGCVTVETLDPLMKDKDYLKTYDFYRKMGFEIYARNPDRQNPLVFMQRKLMVG